MQKIEEIYKDIPEMVRYNSIVGISHGLRWARDSAPQGLESADRSQQEIARELMPKFRNLAGVNAFAVSPASLGQGRDKPLQFIIMTSAPFEELQQYVDRLIGRDGKKPRVCWTWIRTCA